jgi:oligopeptide transport system substrate-binding protein
MRKPVHDLKFYFLGPLMIEHSGHSLVKPPTIKSQSLLAYLVLHRKQPTPRESLAGLFWGDRDERKARRSLATALWHIRACFGEEDVLVSDNFSVQINPQNALWVDAEEFEVLASKDDRQSLQSAAHLYKGMFLEGFYDDWVINQRYHLESLYLQDLNRLMLIQETSGDYAEVLSTALKLLQSDFLHEGAIRTAMRAYCREGQRNYAIELYHHAEKALKSELNTLPEKETRVLFHAIMDGKLKTEVLQTDSLPQEPLISTQPHAQQPLEMTFRGSLAGRTEEMSQLIQSWKATLAGENCLFLIEGEAGVGKTRLVEEFAGRIQQQGAWVLPGRCYAFERLLSYQPVIEALSTLRTALHTQELKDFPVRLLKEVGRLIPGLLEDIEVAGEPMIDGQLGEQERLFDGLAAFLTRISAQRPLLIVLEDLQWVSESTLSLLHYLVRHLAGKKVMLLGTFRPEDLDAQSKLLELRFQLDKNGFVKSLRLMPLSETAVTGYIQEISGIGKEIIPLARQLHRATEGNPFFLMEIMKALFAGEVLRLEGNKWQGDFKRVAEGRLPLPPSLRQAILSRVKNLDVNVHDALQMAAVLGREFDFEPFCLLCGKSEQDAAGLLEGLLRSRLIEEGSGILGRDYAFSHHKIQEVIYAELPTRSRQQMHARAGAVLERTYTLQTDLPAGADSRQSETIFPAELAFHFEQGRLADSRLDQKAIHYLLTAGDQARHIYANREAVDLYQKALAIMKVQGRHEQAARVLMKLGLTYYQDFDFQKARQTYQEAFAFSRIPGTDRFQKNASIPLAPHPFRLLGEEPSTLDVTRHPNDPSIIILQALFSGLVRQAPQGEIVPDMAQSWDLLDGGRTYLFHIHPQAHWSSGAPVEASDFVTAWRRSLDSANQTEASSLLFDVRGARDYHLGQGPVEGIGAKAIDEKTLLVELENPCGYFLTLLANPLTFPVPTEKVLELGDAWSQPQHLVTNGAFRLASWHPGQDMLLTRTTDYHRRPEGNVEQVYLAFVLPWSGGLELYAADQLDVLDISFFQPANLEAVRWQYADDYHSLPRLATGFSGFDTCCPPFNDVRVRRAFAQSIDRQALASLMRHDQVFPASGGFVPLDMPGHNPGIALPYDPPQARKQLAEAGYPGGRGFPEVISGVPQVTAVHVVGQFIHDQWMENLGIEITSQALPLNQLSIGDRNNPMRIFNYACNANFPDPASFLQDSGPLVQTQWHNKQYKSLIDEARRSMDQERRMQIYARAEHILVAEVPLVPLFYMRRHLLVKPWIQRFYSIGGDGFHWKEVILSPHS